jgi:hypothetical protein
MQQPGWQITALGLRHGLPDVTNPHCPVPALAARPRNLESQAAATCHPAESTDQLVASHV